MDKIGADFFYSVESLHDRLQANAHPIQIQSELKKTSLESLT